MNENIIQFKYWWNDNGLNFSSKIDLVMKSYGNLDYLKIDDFNNQQKSLLRSYYNANKLLIQTYLNSGCIVSDRVRKEIEETLFLPLTEIEKLKRETN